MIGDILQPTHLLFVLVVALLVLGPKRLPEVGKALGRGLRDFKEAVSGDELRDAFHHHEETPRELEPHTASEPTVAEPAHEEPPTAVSTPAEVPAPMPDGEPESVKQTVP